MMDFEKMIKDILTAANRQEGQNMKRNPYGWNYPPGAEHDPRAPWNRTPEYRTPDKDDILDLIDRAASLADDVSWLETQYDNQPSGINDAEKKIREVAAFLQSLLDELEKEDEE